VAAVLKGVNVYGGSIPLGRPVGNGIVSNIHEKGAGR
jgi:hypothetical protein